jgi:hypothetical protein
LGAIVHLVEQNAIRRWQALVLPGARVCRNSQEWTKL